MSPVEQAIVRIGAQPADIAGLWNVPGHPELTTNQMMQVAGFKFNPLADVEHGRSMFDMSFDSWWTPTTGDKLP